MIANSGFSPSNNNSQYTKSTYTTVMMWHHENPERITILGMSNVVTTKMLLLVKKIVNLIGFNIFLGVPYYKNFHSLLRGKDNSTQLEVLSFSKLCLEVYYFSLGDQF